MLILFNIVYPLLLQCLFQSIPVLTPFHYCVYPFLLYYLAKNNHTRVSKGMRSSGYIQFDISCKAILTPRVNRGGLGQRVACQAAEDMLKRDPDITTDQVQGSLFLSTD